jgi:hypothetical protein
VTPAIGSVIGTDLAQHARDIQEAETLLAQLARQEAELDQELMRLDSGDESTSCPLCAGMLGARRRAVLEDIQLRLNAIRVDMRYYRQRLTQLGQASVSSLRRHGSATSPGRLLFWPCCVCPECDRSAASSRRGSPSLPSR